MTTGYQNVDGTWYYLRKDGALTYTGVTPIMGSSDISGDKNTVVNKMVKMYQKSGRTYPAAQLANGGAASLEQFCQIVYDEAVKEGVKPEVVFGQAMKETGYLQFGGSVKIEQFNFAGLGATDVNPTPASFPDVATGIRAQVQHLKAYASKDNLTQANVDPRFFTRDKRICNVCRMAWTKGKSKRKRLGNSLELRNQSDEPVCETNVFIVDNNIVK